MGVVSIKNEIKTLFLIVNTMNLIASGLFPLSVTLGLLINIQYLHSPKEILFFLTVGLPMLCITTFGIYGAVLERKKMLDVYMVLAGSSALVEIGAALLITGLFWSDTFVFSIFHPSVMLISMVLGVMLAKQIRMEWSPSAPVATAL